MNETKRKTRGDIEVRRNPDNTIDEVVAKGIDMVHIEQMSEDYWWMSISRGNARWTVHFYTGTGDVTGEPIRCRVEKED